VFAPIAHRRGKHHQASRRLRQFAATLRRIAGTRTVISVTHRMESIVSADQVVVLRKGRIEEVRTRSRG
jgi:ABC-type transport system involved in Fe-S cluster assembly fused permease/ATPase subunit